MFTEIKKGLLAGLGAVLLSKEKIEEVVQKRVKDAKLSESEGRRLIEELVDDGQQQFATIEKSLNETLRRGLDRLGVGREEENQRLKHKVDAMEVRLSVLENTVQETVQVRLTALERNRREKGV